MDVEIVMEESKQGHLYNSGVKIEKGKGKKKERNFI